MEPWQLICFLLHCQMSNAKCQMSNVLKKPLLTRILKRDNQLYLFRRLEQCSKKQINCHGSIEFLCLCQEFDANSTSYI